MNNSPSVKNVNVTPQIAREWLKRNRVNRRLSKPLVSRFQREMRANQWIENGETIKFNLDGDLIDGQHRLYAVIAANMPVKLMVAENLSCSEKTIFTIDNGRPRSATDSIHIAGLKYSSHLAALVRFRINLATTKTGPIGNLEILNEIKRDEERYIKAAAASAAAKPICFGPPYGAFFYQAMKRNPAILYIFHDRFCKGTNMESDDPILVLRNHFLALKHSPIKSYGASRYQVYAKLCYHWNKWVKGIKVKYARCPKVESGIIELL